MCTFTAFWSPLIVRSGDIFIMGLCCILWMPLNENGKKDEDCYEIMIEFIDVILSH